MREIKETRMIEEVVGYEAYDGTRFTSKEECRKYEDLTAKDAIIRKFSNLIITMVEEDEDITKANTYGAEEFVGSGVGEGYGLALIRIKDENDLNICNAYSNLFRNEDKFTEDMIGKEIIVGVTAYYCGDHKINGDWKFEYCTVWGTVEDQIALYTKRLREAFEVSKEV